MTPARRRTLAAGVFLRPPVYRMQERPTPEMMKAYLRRARAGIDLFPHLPTWEPYETEFCKFCGRPDWWVEGDCLARVRRHHDDLLKVRALLREVRKPLLDLRDAASLDRLVSINRTLDAIGRVWPEPMPDNE